MDDFFLKYLSRTPGTVFEKCTLHGGVLRVGCHEISKKFQPVLEPDWSAAQQYNHMFQRSTVAKTNVEKECWT